MGDTLSVALIGAGYVSGDHAAAWRAQPGASIRCVVDADPHRARSLAADAGIDEWATDFESLIDRPDIDVVDICLPPRLHLEATVAFLDAGKHVLLEKPFVTSLDEARRLLDAEQNSTTTLMVAENWPYSSVARRVRRLVDDGVLGELFMLRAHNESALYMEHDGALAPALQASSAVGGFTMSAGIHNINLASSLMGGIESIYACSPDRSPSAAPFVERDAAMTARFGNGGVGVMHFTGRSLHLGERRLAFALYGTRGMAEFDILHGRVAFTVDGERTQIEERSPSMGFAEEIAHFCECLAGGATPMTSVRQQLEPLATVLAAYQSMYERREVHPADLLAQAGLSTVGTGGAIDV
ncbi:gfo/Idh/MocA family oxidoreductase [Actinobacteria bacterium YIM 96077]|uniref:Gfo/Idh/MocA family oxidoreductase n=1 Tax=Phytoactinopolyspora halophila TaxID=1981511 RepID=A0A329QTL5_9ACTN|nr:Gfo/Idh/MocA family oxidoreductase [Phytoactinopolyspora halophila]AYY13781.1 gfo/Idh/MocA family oxidoreductase [Actinobacteria bacterium YIM 96077]RAW15675.1 hypothetical protein DPM12_08495 [Phytoactinopolyspora halophila]